MASRGRGMPSSPPHHPALKCAPDADASRPLPPRHACPVRCALRLFGSRRAHCLRCLRHALPSDDGAPAFPRTLSPDGRTPCKTPCAPRRVSDESRRGRAARLARTPSVTRLEDVSIPPPPTTSLAGPWTSRTRRAASQASGSSPEHFRMVRTAPSSPSPSPI